ncbi:MAG: phosphoheptose isomerase, partial [Lentisphaerae bacterium]|nr:phosphoheptose isomerase [Lentisphaerota bacterium]
MSFMFNPYPYEDLNPVNRPKLPAQVAEGVISGIQPVSERLVKEIRQRLQTAPRVTVCLDGYVGADWRALVNLVSGALKKQLIPVTISDLSACYKSSQELDAMLADNLEQDLEKDPVLLFGKLFEGGYETLFDPGKLKALKEKISGSAGVHIVFGAGACSDELREICGIAVYLDVTPKQAILRIKRGGYRNLGDAAARPFKEMMRRCYYYDFELAMHLRAKLLKQDLIDFYIASDDLVKMQMLPREVFNAICASLVKYPFRCKPVYLEGVWGGYYIKRLRNLPETMKNCAWVFDLIPLEVSLLIEAGKTIVEIPFFTFVCKEGDALMGRQCVDTFNGYFPIRFNYDDTWHSNGNM